MRLSRPARFALAFIAALAFVASAADAGPRRARAAHGAPKSGQVQRTVTRTGPDGTSRTSTHDTTWQRGGGNWTRDTVHTGPKGRQSATHLEGTRTENGYTRQTVHTGPKGGVTTRSATGSYDPEARTWTKDVTTTRPDGSTRSVSKVTTVTPEAPPAE